MPFKNPSSARRAKAFTLIEIIVVISIIVILAALLLAVGSSVIANSKIKYTKATLHTLDGIMKDYLAAGNPEPMPTNPLPYTAFPANSRDYDTTTPPSDPINWVRYFKADPTYAKKIEGMKFSTDAGAVPTQSPLNVTIVDGFGTAIRYVPYNSATKTEGYFMSAGPDRAFSSTANPPPPLPARQLDHDEIYSNEP